MNICVADALDSYIWPQATYDLGAYTYPTRAQRERIVATAFAFWRYHRNPALLDLFGEIIGAETSYVSQTSADNPPRRSVAVTLEFRHATALPRDFEEYLFRCITRMLPFNVRLASITVRLATGRSWSVEWSAEFGG